MVYFESCQDTIPTMRFDPELMRDILLDVESLPAGRQFVGTFTYESRDAAEINAHTQLLIDEGYIEGVPARNHQNIPAAFAIAGLTIKGHQFLANARNNTLWKKVIVQAKEKGQSVGLTVLNGLLEQAAKKYAGLE